MAPERFIKALLLILFLANGLTRCQNHTLCDTQHLSKEKSEEKPSFSKPADIIDAYAENRNQTPANFKILQETPAKKIFIPVINFKTHSHAALAAVPPNRSLFRVLII